MRIKFKDVSKGVVLARAVVEISEGIYLNEISVLKEDDDIKIEFPTKNFKGKDGRQHYMHVFMFDSERRKTLFELEIKNAYKEWRQSCKTVLVYES